MISKSGQASRDNPQEVLVDGEMRKSRVESSRKNDILTVGDFWRALIKERHHNEKINTNNPKNNKVEFETHSL